MTDKQLLEQALKRAFQLGQNYWSWADSEYSSHWKKADAAKAEFDKLVEDTIYTTPQQRKPLTHEQRFDLLTQFEPHKDKWEAPAILIDMVEAAHGIKENT